MVGSSQRNGLMDWLIQRISAVFMLVYLVGIFLYVLWHRPMDYSATQLLLSSDLFKWSTLLLLVAVLWHAWIGLWTVFTDYISCRYFRLLLQALLLLALLGYFLWGSVILFG